jgi:hypothetical protein
LYAVKTVSDKLKAAIFQEDKDGDDAIFQTIRSQPQSYTVS